MTTVFSLIGVINKLSSEDWFTKQNTKECMSSSNWFRVSWKTVSEDTALAFSKGFFLSFFFCITVKLLETIMLLSFSQAYPAAA